MTGYGISDVPTIELGDEEQNLLTSLGADATQSALMAEAIILTDEWDHVIGPASKIAAHKGAGGRTTVHSVSCFLTARTVFCFNAVPQTKSPFQMFGQIPAALTHFTAKKKWTKPMQLV